MSETDTGNTAATAPDEGHIIPYSTFVKVWLALLALTGLLVAVSRLKHEALAVPAMLTITPLKAGLVFYYFMHLKYEGTLLKGMLAIALLILVIFIAFLFLDLASR
jgi:cytochrome c oxidase subunit IV